jgi:hypothetical protein
MFLKGKPSIIDTKFTYIYMLKDEANMPKIYKAIKIRVSMY